MIYWLSSCRNREDQHSKELYIRDFAVQSFKCFFSKQQQDYSHNFLCVTSIPHSRGDKVFFQQNVGELACACETGTAI